METAKKLNECVDLAYEEAVRIIEKAQGEKGYIDTQDTTKDNMYFYAYSGEDETAIFEGLITGIRVREGRIEIVGTRFFCGPVRVYFTEESFDTATRNYDEDNFDDTDWEDCWRPIRYSEITLFIPTLFSIVESIGQYCE